MPDRRHHRGPHPDDARAFASPALPALRAAVADLSWLLGRGYASPSSIALVGNRHRLDERQRMAVLRCACSDDARERRATTRVEAAGVRGGTLLIDGYNVLTTVESALAGALILAARDGCWRDLASMHGTFRTVDETDPALELLGRHVAALVPASCCWLLDSPVSNSGRLAARMREMFASRGWTWTVELVHDADAALRDADGIVASADSVVVDRARRWYNLARAVIEDAVPDARVVELSTSSSSC